MANYDIALEILRHHEGGYVVGDPDDSGGETWIGVSRNNFPSWNGWVLIDIMKQRKDFPRVPEAEAEGSEWRSFFKAVNKTFYASEELMQEVREFYLREFWHKVKGDDITDQTVANSIFNFSVNAGIRTGSKIAQRACDATADGVIGNKTVGSINNTVPETFTLRFTIAKIAFYRNLCSKNKKLRKYLYTWVSRSLEV